MVMADTNFNKYDKAKILAEIMFQEDAERVGRGEEPFYQTADDFFTEHPEMKQIEAKEIKETLR